MKNPLLTFNTKEEANQFNQNILSFIDSNDIGKLIETNYPQFHNLKPNEVELLWNTPSKVIDNNTYMELWNTIVQKLYLKSLEK